MSQTLTRAQEAVYLYDQYVLTLKNDGNWYKQTRQAVRDNSYAEYARKCWPFMTMLMQDLGDSSTRTTAQTTGRRFISLMMRRVALHLWHEEEDVDIYRKDRRPDSAYFASVQSLKDGGIAIPGLDRQCAVLPNTSVGATDTYIISTTQPTDEGTIMSAPRSTIAFETKSYIFGTDIADMTTEQLIAAVQQVEDSIAKLRTVKTQSTKITSMIREQEDFLAKIVTVLDAS